MKQIQLYVIFMTTPIHNSNVNSWTQTKTIPKTALHRFQSWKWSRVKKCRWTETFRNHLSLFFFALHFLDRDDFGTGRTFFETKSSEVKRFLWQKKDSSDTTRGFTKNYSSKIWLKVSMIVTYLLRNRRGLKTGRKWAVYLH